MNTLWIAIGGALGTVARYGVSSWAAAAFGAAFPVGTLLVNVVGSLLISLVTTVALATNLVSPALRLALTTGVMGGFTTYSSFNLETLSLAQSGTWGLAVLNVALTVVGCLAAGIGGIALGRWLVGG